MSRRGDGSTADPILFLCFVEKKEKPPKNFAGGEKNMGKKQFFVCVWAEKSVWNIARSLWIRVTRRYGGKVVFYV